MDLCDKVCFELFNFDVSSGSTGCNVWALNDLLIPGACLRPDMPGIGETNTLEKRKQLQKWGQAPSKWTAKTLERNNITPILPDTLQLSMFTTIKRHSLLLEKNVAKFSIDNTSENTPFTKKPWSSLIQVEISSKVVAVYLYFSFFSFQGTNLLHDRIRGSNELKSPN